MAATGGTIGLHQRYRTMMVHAMDITYLYQVFSRVHCAKLLAYLNPDYQLTKCR